VAMVPTILSLPGSYVRNELYRTIILPTVLQGCYCWSLSHNGNNLDWGCSRTRCWGEYLGL